MQRELKYGIWLMIAIACCQQLCGQSTNGKNSREEAPEFIDYSKPILPAPDDKLFVVVTSNSVTVTPAGGTAPYTHLWTYVSGDSAPVPTSSTAASTAFSATVGRDQEKIAVWKDTVTDALGATTSVNVSVSLFHNSNL